ncbi:MAG: tail fiber domain-containing protein [Gemmatimonadota bacterium]|nr:MAG: tail fiber domain-containing protein [Gemmatimonadota bacterium]
MLAPTENSFTVRASGGVYLYTNPSLTSGMILPNGGSGWDAVSDRNLKDNFRDEDGEHALAAIADMPIQSWNYKAQGPSIRHMGPMAQDFYAAFGLGTDDKHINTVDIDGVNMLAIQALERRTSDLRAENELLRARIADLEAALLRLEAAVLVRER